MNDAAKLRWLRSFAPDGVFVASARNSFACCAKGCSVERRFQQAWMPEQHDHSVLVPDIEALPRAVFLRPLFDGMRNAMTARIARIDRL